MSLSNIKLVVTDMDGTLLNDNHEVSTLFFKLFKQLKQHHILFVAASGRPYYSIIDKLNVIKDDIIIASENGAYMVYKDKTLLSTSLSTENLKRLTLLTKRLDNIHAIFCAKGKAYITKESKALIPILSKYYNNYNIVDDALSIDDEIFKIALYHEYDSAKYIYPYVKHMEGDFKVKISATHWVDISENLANKGHAISLLQKSNNIKPEETLVFGDYLNDIEMLKCAHYSYAMQNAHDDVKAIANYSTKSNNEDGVSYILEQLIASKVGK